MKTQIDKDDSIKVFISYARADAKYKEELVRHLEQVTIRTERDGRRDLKLDILEDSGIQAGERWAARVGDFISGCDIALLLVSKDFLGSKFIQDEELPLLEKRRDEGVELIPVVVRDCLWKDRRYIEERSVLPDGRFRPLSKNWNDDYERDASCLNVAENIKNLLESGLKDLTAQFNRGTSSLAEAYSIGDSDLRRCLEATCRAMNWFSNAIRENKRLRSETADDRFSSALRDAMSLYQLTLWKRRYLGLFGTLTSHRGVVNDVAFGPVGDLASAGDDKKVIIWHRKANEKNARYTQQKTLRHDGPVFAVAFDSTGRFLASGSEQLIYLWEMVGKQPKVVKVLSGHSRRVNGVAFSENGHWLATASDDKTVRLWPLFDALGKGNENTLDMVDEPREVVVFKHEGGVNAVAFCCKERWLATASWDKKVRLWKIPELGKTEMESLSSQSPDREESGNPIELEHAASVNDVALSQPEAMGDTFMLASAGWDRIVHVWKLHRHEDKLTVPNSPKLSLEGHTGKVNSVVFSSKGNWLATTSWDNTVKLWSLTLGGQLIRAIERFTLRGHGGLVTAAAMSSSDMLATASFDGTVKLWDIAGKTSLTLNADRHERVLKISFINGENDLLRIVSANRRGNIKTWEVNYVTAEITCKYQFRDATHSMVGAHSGESARTGADRTFPAIENVSSIVNCVDVSPDGAVLVAGYESGEVWLWDSTDTSKPLRLDASSRGVNAVCFDAERKVVSAGCQDGRTVVFMISSTKDGGEKLEPDRVFETNPGGESYPVYGVTFAPDGSLVADGRWDKTARLWSLDDNPSDPQTLPQHRASTGEAQSDQSGNIGHRGGVNNVCFSEDGLRLATSSWDGTACIWSTTAPSHNELVIRTGHQGGVNVIAFSSDSSQFLATAGGDKIVRIWDTKTGASELSQEDCEISLRTLPRDVTSLAFSSDNQYLAAVTEDGLVQVVALDFEKSLSFAERLLKHAGKQGFWSKKIL